ncbi:hypothetical protein V8G54_033378, partial [Vigna mungo]
TAVEGIIDGSTGLLYYWNPETNVTQYEKPSFPLPPPFPPPPPLPASVAFVTNLAPIYATQTIQAPIMQIGTGSRNADWWDGVAVNYKPTLATAGESLCPTSGTIDVTSAATEFTYGANYSAEPLSGCSVYAAAELTDDTVSKADRVTSSYSANDAVPGAANVEAAANSTSNAATDNPFPAF